MTRPRVIGIKSGTHGGSLTLEHKDKMFVGKTSWSLVYIVMGTSLDDTPATILDAPGVPPLFARLWGGNCSALSPKEIDTVIDPNTGARVGLWEVQADFRSDILDDDKDRPPEARRPRVSWGGENEDEQLHQDAVTGKPIQTPAGEPLLLMAPVLYPVLSISRYERGVFAPLTMMLFCNHVNAAPFWGAPPGTALMLPMEVTEEVIDRVRYSNVRYRIKFAIRFEPEHGAMQSDTWMARPLARGFLYFPEGEDDPRLNVDKHNNPTETNLDASGRKLAAQQPPLFLAFHRFPKANFNLLSLGPF